MTTIETASYKIYVPNKNAIKFDRTWLEFSVGLIVFLLYFLPFEVGEKTKLVFAACVFVFYLFLLATRFTYKPLYGKLQGEIEFSLDGIAIDGHKFEIEKVTNIEIEISDYYGQYVSGGGRFNFNRIFSQGVKNQLSFEICNQESYCFNFRLENKVDHKKWNHS